MLTILYLFGAWYLAAKGKQQLAAAIAATDATDPRWRWEHLEEDRPRVPDAENSITVVKEMASLIRGWAPVGLEVNDKPLFDGRPSNQLFDEARLTFLRDTLDQRNDAVTLAISLKDYPRGHAPIQLENNALATPLPHAQPCQWAFWLLELEVERLLHEGKTGDVDDRIQAILYSVAGLRNDPMLISALVRLNGQGCAVRCVERLLALSEAESSDLKQLQGHLESELRENVILPGLRGERACFHVLLDNIDSGRFSFASLIAELDSGRRGSQPDTNQQLFALVYRPLRHEDRARLLKLQNEAIRIGNLESEKQIAEWESWLIDVKSAKTAADSQMRFMMTSVFLPAVYRVAMRSLVARAALSCATTALAAERFRQANQRWPNSLDELTPDYLEKPLLDPFDGKPLKLAKNDQGIVIYSVYKDRQDDGGANLDPVKVRDQHADVGIKLWDPAHRRVPAVPNTGND